MNLQQVVLFRLNQHKERKQKTMPLGVKRVRSKGHSVYDVSLMALPFCTLLARVFLVSGVLISLGTASPTRAGIPKETLPRKVILDDDGFSFAQMMVIKAPNVDVLGICTVTGDIWQKEATQRALRGVELSGHPDVPVYGGAVYPLLNTEAQLARWEALYGKLSWKGVWTKSGNEATSQSSNPYHGPDVVPPSPLGTPSGRARQEHAANFMIEMVHRYPHQVSIIETGPFTTIALAQRLDPEFAGLAKELVYMGGSLNPRQTRVGKQAADYKVKFLNTPRREFNILFDPEAAQIVLRAPWKKIVMVPDDPTADVALTPPLIRRLRASGRWSEEMVQNLASGFPLWDEIAAAVWLEPTLIKKQTKLFIDVDTNFSAGYGNTLSWPVGSEPKLGETVTNIVQSIDVPRFEDFLVARLADK